MRRSFALACGWSLAFIGYDQAVAAEPTFDQLLATPAAAEIVETWRAICVSNAGNTKAQKQAVRQLAITWPYQAMFLKESGQPACVIASSIAPAGAASALRSEIVKVVTLGDMQFEGSRTTGTTMIQGQAFKVSFGTETPGGNTVAVLALTPIKGSK